MGELAIAGSFGCSDTAGRVGVGEASLDPAAGPAEVTALADLVRATIPGLAAAGAVDRWLTSDHESADEVRLGLRAAIVGAALDLGVVPWARSSAPAASVRVNATIATEDPGSTVAAARAAVGAGFTSIKIKGGGEATAEALVTRLAAVRAAVGPEIELRLDVNGAWDATTARLRLAALADLDLAYVEQPIAAGDVPALVGLRRGSPVRIAADESVASRSAARALLEAGAADVLVVKPARVGGALEALAIAEEAAAVGVGVTISTLLETGVGLVTALHVAASLAGRRGSRRTGSRRRRTRGRPAGDSVGDRDPAASPCRAGLDSGSGWTRGRWIDGPSSGSGARRDDGPTRLAAAGPGSASCHGAAGGARHHRWGVGLDVVRTSTGGPMRSGPPCAGSGVGAGRTRSVSRSAGRPSGSPRSTAYPGPA